MSAAHTTPAPTQRRVHTYSSRRSRRCQAKQSKAKQTRLEKTRQDSQTQAANLWPRGLRTHRMQTVRDRNTSSSNLMNHVFSEIMLNMAWAKIAWLIMLSVFCECRISNCEPSPGVAERARASPAREKELQPWAARGPLRHTKNRNDSNMVLCQQGPNGICLKLTHAHQYWLAVGHLQLKVRHTEERRARRKRTDNDHLGARRRRTESLPQQTSNGLTTPSWELASRDRHTMDRRRRAGTSPAASWMLAAADKLWGVGSSPKQTDKGGAKPVVLDASAAPRCRAI